MSPGHSLPILPGGLALLGSRPLQHTFAHARDSGEGEGEERNFLRLVIFFNGGQAKCLGIGMLIRGNFLNRQVEITSTSFQTAIPALLTSTPPNFLHAPHPLPRLLCPAGNFPTLHFCTQQILPFSEEKIELAPPYTHTFNS